VIFDLKQELRNKLKHEGYQGKEYEMLDMINELLLIYLNEHNVIGLFLMFDIMLKNYNTSEGKLIEACKYGYDFHKTSQFPDMEFEKSSALGNFKQKLMSESIFVEDFYRSNLDWMKMLFDSKYDMKPLDNDDLENK